MLQQNHALRDEQAVREGVGFGMVSEAREDGRFVIQDTIPGYLQICVCVRESERLCV